MGDALDMAQTAVVCSPRGPRPTQLVISERVHGQAVLSSKLRFSLGRDQAGHLLWPHSEAESCCPRRRSHNVVVDADVDAMGVGPLESNGLRADVSVSGP